MSRPASRAGSQLLPLGGVASLHLAPMAKNRKSPAATRPREGKRQVLCILSRKKTLYSTRRLVQAAKEQGHRPVVLDTLKCNIVVQTEGPEILYGTERLKPPSVVIPRIGASITAYGLAVVNHFDMMGVPVVNNSVPIARSRDKLRCLQLLARFGVPVPKTLMAHQRTAVEKLLDEVGGLPVIVKLLQGTQGIGVMIASTLEEAQTLLNTFWDLGHDVLLQQFIQESVGRDVRAFVVGERVVAAMRRTAKEGEFRSNIHRGGEGTPAELTDELARVAVSAARIVGLEVAGVDLLESRAGPLVLEVNSSPGFEGIEGATRLDVAGTIVRHAVQFARDQRAGVRKPRMIRSAALPWARSPRRGWSVPQRRLTGLSAPRRRGRRRAPRARRPRSRASPRQSRSSRETKAGLLPERAAGTDPGRAGRHRPRRRRSPERRAQRRRGCRRGSAGRRSAR